MHHVSFPRNQHYRKVIYVIPLHRRREPKNRLIMAITNCMTLTLIYERRGMRYSRWSAPPSDSHRLTVECHPGTLLSMVSRLGEWSAAFSSAAHSTMAPMLTSLQSFPTDAFDAGNNCHCGYRIEGALDLFMNNACEMGSHPLTRIASIVLPMHMSRRRRCTGGTGSNKNIPDGIYGHQQSWPAKWKGYYFICSPIQTVWAVAWNQGQDIHTCIVLFGCQIFLLLTGPVMMAAHCWHACPKRCQ